MKYLKEFINKDNAINSVVSTPFIGKLKDIEDILYVPSNVGKNIAIIQDNNKDYFINYQKVYYEYQNTDFNNKRVNDQHILNIITKNYQIILDKNIMALSPHIMCLDDISDYYIFHYCGDYQPWKLKGGPISEIGIPWKNTEYWWKYYNKIKIFN